MLYYIDTITYMTYILYRENVIILYGFSALQYTVNVVDVYEVLTGHNFRIGYICKYILTYHIQWIRSV